MKKLWLSLLLTACHLAAREFTITNASAYNVTVQAAMYTGEDYITMGFYAVPSHGMLTVQVDHGVFFLSDVEAFTGTTYAFAASSLYVGVSGAEENTSLIFFPSFSSGNSGAWEMDYFQDSEGTPTAAGQIPIRSADTVQGRIEWYVLGFVFASCPAAIALAIRKFRQASSIGGEAA